MKLYLMGGSRNMKKKEIIVCLYLMLILILLQLTAISASSKTVELNPIEDSYIEFGEPDINNGAASDLTVTGECWWSSGEKMGDRRAYIKFDLSSIPPNAQIDSAILQLYFNYKNVDETCSIGCYYCSDNSWNELLINWNNAPSHDSTATDVNNQIAFKNQWYSWTVTDAVNKALPGNSITFVMCRERESGVLDFNSKDAYSNHPKLTMEYEGGNVAPTASASYLPSNPTTDDTVQFTDKSTDDGNIVSWLWDFGDGGTSTEQNPQYKYGSSGTYTITLEVTDNGGASDSTTGTITVSEPFTEPDEGITGEDDGETNGDTTSKTPGFELIIAICSIISILFWKRHKKK